MARSGLFKVTFLAVWLLALAGTATTAAAQPRQEPGFAKEGMFVGVGGLMNFTLDSDEFSGTLIYVSEDDGEQTIIPALDKRHVFRGVIGFRAERAALEFSYDRARFSDDFLGLTGNSTFNSLNVDVRVFFATKKRFQPYVLAGGAFPWLTIDNATYEANTDPLIDLPIADGIFRGYGVNAEVGVAAHLTPRFGVMAGYSHRVIFFRYSKDSGGDREDLKPPFDVTRGSATVLGFFTF